MRPLQSKLIVAFALGLIALGVLAWISVKTLVPSRAPAVASDAAPISAIPHVGNNIPNKIVTMVGIPEVIVSPPAASGAESDSPDGKPSAHKPVSATPRRSDDNWLVKPE